MPVRGRLHGGRVLRLGDRVVRRLAEDAAGGLCARAPGRLDDILALGEQRALDLGDGVRALVEAGVLRMVQTPRLPVRS